MTDLVALFGRSLEGFDARVRAVGDDQWGNATPCADWDVRALLNHLVGEQRWAPPLFEGSTIAEVGSRFDGDLLGDDPKAAWADSLAQSAAAVREPGVLERTVHLSFGDTTGEDYLSQLVLDLVVHAWDLARGIGGDEALDPDGVEFALGYIGPRVDGWRAAGVFGPAVDVAPDADPQTRLLALTGRPG